MIRELEFKNFQGFKGKQKITLAPITLIFGPNSTGKSSIVRAINLLIGHSDDIRTSKHSRRNAEIISQNLLYGQNSENEEDSWFEVSATYDVDQDFEKKYQQFSRGLALNSRTDVKIANYKFTFSDLESQKIYNEAKSKQLEQITNFISFISEKLSSEELDPESWRKYVKEEKNSSLEEKEFSEDNFRANLRNIHDGLSEFKKTITEQREADFTSWIRETIDFSFSSLGDFKLADPGVEILNLMHLMSFDNVNPLAEIPLDWTPSFLKSLVFSGNKAEFANNNDEPFYENSDGINSALYLAIQACNEIADRNLQNFKSIDPLREVPTITSGNAENQVTLNAINLGLEKLTNGRYKFEKQLIQNSIYSNKMTNLIRDTYTGAILEFKDVGSGLSQVLPMLEAIYGHKWSTIYIEQPELHLHPKMQSELMDIFIQTVNSKKESGKQLLIETHSESMLLRLQKRIREKSLDSRDVSIIFTDSQEELDFEGRVKSRYNTISEIQLDSSGDILDPFPTSFVNLRIQDLL